MDTKNTEKVWYNAVMVAVDGNPAAIRAIYEKFAKRSGGGGGEASSATGGDGKNNFPGWAAAFEYLADGGKVGRMEPHTRATMPNPDEEWENLEQRGIRLIFRDEPEFPPLLREIGKAPLAIYVRGGSGGYDSGDNNIFSRAPAITIVGTRRATPDGKAIARRFARELARAGFAIVSGLALGIDAEAHEGCLEAGAPTVAVLACGLDKIYPRENERLGERILAAGGAIISEYPSAQPPYPDRFLERNRIVSGLSRGTLLIECPSRSGSIATANYALEQNRDVFVVPGSILHPNFAGSHELIRQGATLVTSPDDILKEYGLLEQKKTVRIATAATSEEKLILSVLNVAHGPLNVDKIVELTRLEPRVVTQALAFLVLREIVKETGMGYIIE